MEGAKCLNALADVCGVLGRKREAVAYCTASLRLNEQTGNLRGQSAALHNLGLLLVHTDREQSALRYMERAIEIDLAAGAPAEAAKTMSFAAVLQVRQNPDGAYELSRRALDTARQVGDNVAIAVALLCLVQVLLERQEWQAALEFMDEVLVRARKLTARVMEGNALFLHGLVLDRSGDTLAALTKFEEAIHVLEESYLSISSQDLRLSYFSAFTIQNIYLVYSACLVEYARKTGNASLSSEAFHVCERRHARGLREFVQMKQLGFHVCGRESRQPSDSPEPSSANPLTVAQVQADLIGDDAALLEFSIHHEIGYLWAITRTEQTVVPLSLGGSEIRERVRQLRESVVDQSQRFRHLSHELYRVLIQPVEPLLIGKRYLLIVPDDALHLLPFQVLLTQPSESRASGDLPYFVRSHAIAYAPSATIFDVLRQRRTLGHSQRRSFIAFAPVEFGPEGVPLPGTLFEVDKIAQFFAKGDAVLKVRAAATKSAALSGDLGDFRYIHFATHGCADDTDPDGALVVFHRDAEGSCHLRAREVANLDLHAELVVLSACETALGTVSAGEGVLGLVRGFFCAGAQSVCASMWRVDDSATATLMTAFYGNLVTKGLPPVEALRLSQLQLIDGQWSAPRFWGAFVLAGM